MIIEAGQQFTLPFPGPAADALAFVRDPARALSQVRFLRDLRADGAGVRGELLVPLPVLGAVDLPFRSALRVTPHGAALEPQPPLDERAWVDVTGDARVLTPNGAAGGVALHFDFHFRAHLATPAADGWGTAAFEKMVRAAAGRTLDRVARELPRGIQAALAPTAT